MENPKFTSFHAPNQPLSLRPPAATSGLAA